MFEKGRRKTGGRKRGTPNKLQISGLEWLTQATNDETRRARYLRIIDNLPDDKFLREYGRMLELTTPKTQCVTMAAQIEAEQKNIRLLLEEGTPQAIEAITEKLMIRSI